MSHVALDVEAGDKKACSSMPAGMLENDSGLDAAARCSTACSRASGSARPVWARASPFRTAGSRACARRSAPSCALRSPIPFDAPDEQPVNLVFVLLVPERATDLHLQILSELAQMFSDREFRAQLAAAPDALAAQRLIADWQAHAPNS